MSVCRDFQHPQTGHNAFGMERVIWESRMSGLDESGSASIHLEVIHNRL
jgi:hypothetical protein